MFSLLRQVFNENQNTKCDKKSNKYFITPFEIIWLRFLIRSVGIDYDERKSYQKTQGKD